MKNLLLLILLLIITSSAHARYKSVSWDAVAGATSYTLYWGETSGGPYTHSLDVGNVTTYQLAINETTVYMVVTATDGTGEGPQSSEITIPPNPTVSTNTGSILQTFSLETAEASATYPFTVGLVFSKGDTTGPTLDIADYACTTKRLWNDGSVKHAICSGYVAMVTDTPKTINVYSSGTPPTGTDLTEADIVKAAPTASVTLGSYGTVKLSSLLGSPLRTFISTPLMVEVHYASLVGTEVDLDVSYHVRMYRDGEVWVRAIGGNGLRGDTVTEKTYIPDVTIDGVTIWDNGSASFTHRRWVRWDQMAWVGATDPDLKIAQDTTYMMATKLVPNYWKMGPSEDTLNGIWGPSTYDPLSGAYSPGSIVDWHVNQLAPGFQTQIGLLPWWDALYLNSGADKRAYDFMIGNARGGYSYPIYWTDTTTHAPLIISDYPTFTWNDQKVGNNDTLWDLMHHGSMGYLPYLVTGEYYYMEAMQYQSTLIYLLKNLRGGTGTDRVWSWDGGSSPAERGVAWLFRSLGQAAAILPLEDPINTDIRLNYKANVDYWHNVIQNPDINGLGYIFTSSFYNSPWDQAVAPWMHNWWAAAAGYGVDMEPLEDADMSNLTDLATHLYKVPVGLTGSGGANESCYDRAMSYTYVVSPGTDRDATTWHDSWATCYDETAIVGEYPNNRLNCVDGLLLDIAESPLVSQVGALIMGLSYAAEHGAAGASTALTKIQTASNWTTLENSGFENLPTFGIWPRALGQEPPVTPPKR